MLNSVLFSTKMYNKKMARDTVGRVLLTISNRMKQLLKDNKYKFKEEQN